MDITITEFLLKFLGVFIIIVGASFLKKGNRDNFFYLEKNNAELLGLFSLMICIPIVILHNIWTGPWEILISLMGWGGLLKGINRIIKIPYLYDWRIKKLKSTTKNHGWITMVLGTILLYGGLIYH